MLNKQGFNLWADGYDKTVQISKENNLYPFAGYKLILGSIFNEVMQKKTIKSIRYRIWNRNITIETI